MKILHWAIILVIIVFPISLVCRVNVNAKFSALKDEVRINNAIDTATKDAIDQLISVNEVINFNGEFGDIIDVTPEIAQEMIDTFFHTMAVNYNLPYQNEDFGTDPSISYIKNYFSPYVPAIVIVAYDGFYIYSLEENNGYKYELSSKIPYAYQVTARSKVTHTIASSSRDYFTIGYTLGDDIYLYIDGRSYSGRLNNDSGDVKTKVASYWSSYSLTATTSNPSTRAGFADYIASITNDISCVLYVLSDEYRNEEFASRPTAAGVDVNANKVWIFDSLMSEDARNYDYIVGPYEGILKDYVYSESGEILEQASDFQKKKDEVIIDLITTTLNEEINDHKSFANISGITYEFTFPTISQQDWINTIDDISFLAFVQGIPIGNAEGTYYNNFALGGSKIVQSGYIFTTKIGENLYYHNGKCTSIPHDSYGEVDYADPSIIGIYKSKKEAAADGANPCFICN